MDVMTLDPVAVLALTVAVLALALARRGPNGR